MVLFFSRIGSRDQSSSLTSLKESEPSSPQTDEAAALPTWEITSTEMDIQQPRYIERVVVLKDKYVLIIMSLFYCLMFTGSQLKQLVGGTK